MSKKLLITIVIVAVAGFTGILVLFKGGDELDNLSSSPDSVVKAYYKSLDNGYIDKAKQYLTPSKRLEGFSAVYNDWSLKQFLQSNGDETMEALLGKIEMIDIEGKKIDKIFDSEEAEVVVKVILKLGIKTEAKSKQDIAIAGSYNNSLDPTKSAELDRAIDKLGVLIHFPENQKCYLEKWKEEWKIIFCEGL